MRFCQSFMTELYKPHRRGYRRARRRHRRGRAVRSAICSASTSASATLSTGVLTGKGLTYGGSLARTEATGYGLLLLHRGDAQVHTAMTLRRQDRRHLRLRQRGHLRHARRPRSWAPRWSPCPTPPAVSTMPNGIDLACGQADQGSRARPHQRVCRTACPAPTYTEGCRASGPSRATSPCPAPPRMSCDRRSARAAGRQRRAWPWRRAPTCPPPPRPPSYFQEHGVLFAPAKAANAGGVATCGLEMSQNSDALLAGPLRKWTRKLKGIMENIFHSCRRRRQGVRHARATYVMPAPTSPAS